MFSLTKTGSRAGLALVVLASLATWQDASAAGTAANTTISNKATVNYTVGAVPQTAIESSPTGNAVAGAGAGTNTTFLVDNKIDLTVVELGGVNTSASPGQNNVVATFTVTNTGNSPQGYQLAATNLVGTLLFGNTDNTQMANLRVFVDSNGNGTYDSGVDIATAIDTLNPDVIPALVVFIVADTPVTATNGQFANVELSVRAAAPGTNGATLMTQTAGADTPTVVDVVFADTDRDATALAVDQYAITSAALSVAKTSTTVADPFNGATNPKAIPGAFVEYVLTLTNNGALPAAGVSISDPLPANTAYRTASYNGGASDVQVNVGAGAPTYCLAEAGGTDTNADGCYRTATDLVVGAPAVGGVGTGAAAAVTVRFQVTIN